MTTTEGSNPLLQIGLEVPFDRIRAEHVRPAVAILRAQAERAIEAITTHGPRTYRGVLGALSAATEPLSRAMAVIEHLESVATSDDMRAAYDAIQAEVAEFWSSIPLNAPLYAALEAVQQSEGATLRPIQQRHLNKTLDEFRRQGARLSPSDKTRLAAIDVELSQVTTRYAQHVLDATHAFEWVTDDPTQLAGLPPSALDAARASAQAKGLQGWRLTLQGPSYVAAMTYLDDPQQRQMLWQAYNTRACAGALDNRPLIHQILRLRRERARLLGYAQFADLVLADRMAQTGDEARRFIDRLRVPTHEPFATENTELQAFRCKIQGPDAPPIEAWDVAYWAEKQRRARFDFDQEALRPYFALPQVLRGLFELVHRLYGVRIEPAPSMPTWHPSVQAYGMFDHHDQSLGRFYVDAYPRETKRGGAWMHALITGEPASTGNNGHLALICANVTAPVDDRPALLTHREVQTLFHEFGHLMHHMLSRVEVRDLGGINVAWDFVELPSQIMENWCWERECLDLFATHWSTGEPIPDALFTRFVRTRAYRAANAMMRQLGLASVDLMMHMDLDAESSAEDIVERARQVLADHAATRLPDDYCMITSFGHLFSHPVGYAAGYYSYQWAEVLDADAFTRFLDHGLFNPTVGAEFRDRILARGDSLDPMELYREFMGRPPSIEPLLRRSGLAPGPTDG